MLRIDVNGLHERLSQSLQRQVARAAGEVPSEQEVRDGLRVSLSELGRMRAAAKNDDIDKADLPDHIREILKQIRALRQQIAEKQAELQALAAEAMDPLLRQMRTEALRGELSSLQNALISTLASLVEALHDKGLSDGQRMQATSLAMA